MSLRMPAHELKSILKTLSLVTGDSKGFTTVLFDTGTGKAVAADPEIVLETSSNFLKSSPQRVLFNVNSLSSVVQSLSGDVVLDIKKDITVTAGKSKLRIPTSAETPLSLRLQDAPEKSCVIPATALKLVLSQASSALDKHYYTNIKLEARGEFLRAVATDGKRLLIAEVSSPGYSTVLSGRVAKIIQGLSGDSFNLSETDAALYVDNVHTRILAKKTTARFPEYEQIVPKLHKVEFTIPAEDFLRSLKRISPLVTDRRVSLSISDGDLVLRSTSGDAEDITSIEVLSDDVFDMLNDTAYAITLDHQFLISFLELFTGEVRVGLNGETDPVLITAGNARLVLAPITAGQGVTNAN